jgi:trehalose 6-phosphate synthase
MEYVAAQDEEDPGVLVLSRFAGAAASLESALIVNPHDPGDTAEAMHQGLTMSRQERQERWRALMRRIEEDSAAAWCRRFLARLAAPSKTLRAAS